MFGKIVCSSMEGLLEEEGKIDLFFHYFSW